MAWLSARDIRTLSWPAKSPDLNPIENLWGLLSRRVYVEGKQYANVQELKDLIRRAWQGIGDKVYLKLISSMKNRLLEVLK